MMEGWMSSIQRQRGREGGGAKEQGEGVTGAKRKAFCNLPQGTSQIFSLEAFLSLGRTAVCACVCVCLCVYAVLTPTC